MISFNFDVKLDVVIGSILTSREGGREGGSEWDCRWGGGGSGTTKVEYDAVVEDAIKKETQRKIFG